MAGALLRPMEPHVRERFLSSSVPLLSRIPMQMKARKYEK